MSVVSARTRLRWGVVACGTGLLCSLPAIVAALPVPGSHITAAQLRSRVAASASVAYQGYAESTVNLGLPTLPGLANVSALFDGSTDQYVWYRSPSHWRADVVTGAGEDDTYQSGPATYLWSYSQNLFTEITGAVPVRLPRAADLLPPPLARRLVSIASPADGLSRLPSRRVAGVAAAGLRIRPAEPGTIVTAVDIWADPASGLPLEVQVFSRGSAKPVLVSTLLDLSQSRPPLSTVTPAPGPGTGFTATTFPNLNHILNSVGDVDGDRDHEPFPATLGGAPRVTVHGSPAGVAVYGQGFARFVLVPLPHGAGGSAFDAASQAGPQVRVGPQTGVVIQTPLVTVLMFRDPPRPAVFMLTGAVTPAVLERAGASLIAVLKGVK